MTVLRQLLLEQDGSAAAISTERPAANPDVDRVIEQLNAGTRFAMLRQDDVGARAAALEAIVEHYEDGNTKLAWIGNPLRSPLTIGRVFLQAVGAEADLRFERSPADLAAMLTRSAGTASRLILIVQQPETLDPEARETIAALAACLPDTDPHVQFLFSSSSSFQPLVTAAPSPAQQPRQFARRAARPALFVLLLLGLSVLAATKLLETNQEPTPAPVQTAIQSAPATDLPAAEPPATNLVLPPSARPPSVDTTLLRREFDTFLAQRAPSIPPLSESQKDALFQEFLDRQRQRRDAL